MSAEDYREGERMLKSAPIRALFLWPLVVPPLIVVMVIVSRVVPPELEDAAVLPFEIALGAFVAFAIGGALVLSIRKAYRTSRLGAVPYVLFGVAVVTAIPIKLVPPVLGTVLMGVSGLCAFLTMPATLAWTTLSARAAKGGPVPQKLDGAALQQIVADTRASFQEAARLRAAPYAPVATPFGESPAAQAARVEQLRAFNAMLRAQYTNLGPFYAIWRYALAALPIILGFATVACVWSLVQQLQGYRSSPRSSIPGDVVAIVACTALTIASHLWLSARRELGRRIGRLAAHLSATVVADDNAALLDWLDRHWADTPATYGVAAIGWQWMVAFGVAGRPALLSVIDDLGSKAAPRVRRIDVYLPRPTSAPLLDEGAAGRVRALGYEPVQSPAGLRLERRDNDRGSLEPAAFDTLVRAAGAMR